ncbi:hypothetical protein BDZ97DRAFT_1917961 [Flammula alnicola]|nr:hypothetical protein BDZ97DRAFT_1917961 [Flammula alnicola]
MHHKTLSICFAFLSFLAYTAIGAPVQSSQLTKRNYHTVQQAVHGMTHHVGSGTTGDVYALKHPYQGHNAVVKLLGHGHDAHTDTHYLVMKNMGVGAAHSGLTQEHRNHLNDQANARYAANHGVRNKDQNGGNFVYHSHNGRPQAEIVDWAKTEHLGTHPKVAPMHVEPVNLHHGSRRCPTCVVQ